MKMDTMLTRSVLSLLMLKDTAILLEASVDSRTAGSPSHTFPRAPPAETGECLTAKALSVFFKPGSEAAGQAGGARVLPSHPLSKPPRSADRDQAEREADQNYQHSESHFCKIQIEEMSHWLLKGTPLS